MAHVLTESMYRQLRLLQTSTGFTLDQAIQNGIDCQVKDLEMKVGCLAGDEESYKVFEEFFDPVIEAVHRGFGKSDNHKSHLNSSSLEGEAVFDSNYATRVRISARRNVRGFCLPAQCTRAERRQVEKIVKQALGKLSDLSEGCYISFGDADKENNGIFLNTIGVGASTLEIGSSVMRDWPDARGDWANKEKTITASVNVEDHLILTTSHGGGDIKSAFTMLCTALTLIEEAIERMGLECMWNDHLGYITSCPGKLGTGLDIKTDLELPLLIKHNQFDLLLRKLRLQTECSTGDEVDSLRITNIDYIGRTEVQIVQVYIDGVQTLIQMEEKLSNGEKIDVDIALVKQK